MGEALLQGKDYSVNSGRSYKETSISITVYMSFPVPSSGTNPRLTLSRKCYSLHSSFRSSYSIDNLPAIGDTMITELSAGTPTHIVDTTKGRAKYEYIDSYSQVAGFFLLSSESLLPFAYLDLAIETRSYLKYRTIIYQVYPDFTLDDSVLSGSVDKYSTSYQRTASLKYFE